MNKEIILSLYRIKSREWQLMLTRFVKMISQNRKSRVLSKKLVLDLTKKSKKEKVEKV